MPTAGKSPASSPKRHRRRVSLTLAGIVLLLAAAGALGVAYASMLGGSDPGATFASQGADEDPFALRGPSPREAAETASYSTTTLAATTTLKTTTTIGAPHHVDRLHRAGKPAGDGLPVYSGIPPEGKVIQRLPSTGEFGEDTVIRIDKESVDRRGDTWHYAYLPQKPNGSRGWVRASDVVVFALEHRLVIDLSEHRLDVLKGDDPVASYPVAVGKDNTPTPVGEFFVTVQVKPPNPGGAYGPLALGLSAYSEVLTDWPGGGQSAIHGTNDPGAIGTNASHGCVRMRNVDILAVGELAHVGTPVTIIH